MAPATRSGLGAQFGWLLSSSAAANAGDGITRTLLPLLVVAGHPQPGPLSGLAVANMLPWLLFALPAGALADRLDRRRMVLISNLARAAALVLAAVVFAVGWSLIALFVLAFVLGVGETLFETAAPAMLPAIVADSDLVRANGRLALPQIVLSEMAGPPLAGLLVGIGATAALATGSGLYFVGALLLLGLHRTLRPTAEPTPPGRPSIRDEIALGLRFMLSHRLLRITLAASLLYGLVFSANFTLLVLFSYQELHLHATGYGLLLTVASVGAIVGTWVAPRAAELYSIGTLTRTALVCNGIAYIALGLCRHPVEAGIVLFGNGVLAMCWNIPIVSLRQRCTPAHLQSRAMSVSRLCSWGIMPIGAGLAGLVASASSVRSVLIGSGCVLALGAMVLLAGLDRRAAEARAEPVAESIVES